MTERILTLRELNRTFLARQMLLSRENLPLVDAVERLVGLQAQIPNPPYISLWPRALKSFFVSRLNSLSNRFPDWTKPTSKHSIQKANVYCALWMILRRPAK